MPVFPSSESRNAGTERRFSPATLLWASRDQRANLAREELLMCGSLPSQPAPGRGEQQMPACAGVGTRAPHWQHPPQATLERGGSRLWENEVGGALATVGGEAGLAERVRGASSVRGCWLTEGGHIRSREERSSMWGGEEKKSPQDARETKAMRRRTRRGRGT